MSLFKLKELWVCFPVSVKTSKKSTCWKIVEVGENIYLPSHTNVFWLARADGIASPFFTVWWFYTDRKVVYSGYCTPHHSWELSSNTTGVLLPETSLWSYLGGKWNQAALILPQIYTLNLSLSETLCCSFKYLLVSFLHSFLFQVYSSKLLFQLYFSQHKSEYYSCLLFNVLWFASLTSNLGFTVVRTLCVSAQQQPWWHIHTLMTLIQKSNRTTHLWSGVAKRSNYTFPVVVAHKYSFPFINIPFLCLAVVVWSILFL